MKYKTCYSAAVKKIGLFNWCWFLYKNAVIISSGNSITKRCAIKKVRREYKIFTNIHPYSPYVELIDLIEG